MNREQIRNEMQSKRTQIQGLKNELIELYKQDCLLCDGKQWFTDFVPEEDTYCGEECYSGIVEAKNRKQGKADAERKGLEMFEADLGKYNDDVKVKVDTFYETCGGARAN